MWYEALSATITEPMTCSEKVVLATTVVFTLFVPSWYSSACEFETYKDI
jgi:hypothetical protein